MAEPKDQIISRLDPKIPLQELWTTDDSEINAQNPIIKTGSSTTSAKDTIGTVSPYVMINGTSVSNIDQLIIDQTGMIPKIKMIFIDSFGEFTGPNYPKNNPIVSVYFKPGNSNFKPIRADFLIKSLKSNQDATLHKRKSGTEATFILDGELYIPKLYDNTSKCYANMTSKEALMRIADEIDLGYADNTFTTNDKMSWINPNKNYAWMINDIAKHAYLNDDTFFKVFIDVYYHINFISVTEQLNPMADLAYTFSSRIESTAERENNYIKSIEEEVNNIDDNNLDYVRLTNLIGTEKRPYHIINYGMAGEVGRILKNKGYKKQIYYYDHTINGEKFVSFFVNPIKVKGYEKNDKNSYLIPDDDILKNSTIKKWMNIDYGNAHREWNASVLINDLNNSELNKVKLVAETEGINFQVIRGMGVPVLIYTTISIHAMNSNKRTDEDYETELDKNNSDKLVKDDALSGRYMVGGLRYIYNKLEDYSTKTEMHLVRMNWIGEKNML